MVKAVRDQTAGQIEETEVVQDSDAPARARLAPRLVETNVHAETFLATDYLNHFNEIIMLLELIPEMPECLEDARAWKPVDYVSHFRNSGLSDGPVAIEAYAVAPACFRKPFDQVVADLETAVMYHVGQLARLVDGGEVTVVAEAARTETRELQGLVDRASAIIHGDLRDRDLAVGETQKAASGSGPALNQDDIDALFD